MLTPSLLVVVHLAIVIADEIKKAVKNLRRANE